MPKRRSLSLVAILAGLTAVSVGCSSASESAEPLGPVSQVSSELNGDPSLSLLGTWKTDSGSVEISAYDKKSKRLFIVNSASTPTRIEVLNLANPAAPVKIGEIVSEAGVPNSVAVHDGLVAIAWEAADRYQPGSVAFHDAKTLAKLGSAPAGVIPDNVVFTKNGDKVLVANEGEPVEDYAYDPEGSVTIVEIKKQGKGYRFDSETVRFLPNTPLVNQESIRIFGGGGTFNGISSPPSTPAQDFEPEYITVSDDGKTAWVTLQENNAIAILDIKQKKFTKVVGLGFKDHSLPGNGFDASDRDGLLGNIQNWPVKGMYEPDAIAYFKVKGKEYTISANEGDAREWGAFTEEARVAALVPLQDANGNYIRTPGRTELRIDHPAVLDGSAADPARLGRLTVSTAVPRTADGAIKDIYSYGARSFSIRDKDGNLVFDSGDEIERRLGAIYPGFDNSDQTADPAPDSRSDNKGPEPEGLTVAKIEGKYFAFIGLERIGGILVYDIDNPQAPRFVTYVNNRDLTNPAAPGDLGPEGIKVIDKSESPNHKPILVVSNEVSGNVTLYQINTGNCN